VLLKVEPARLNFREIQDVVDNRDEGVGRTVDRLDEVSLFIG